MKTRLLIISLIAGLYGVAEAQTAEDLNEGLSITHDPAAYPTLPYELAWWTRPSFYYFVLQTSDLTQPWVYHDFAVKGQAGAGGLGEIEGFRFDSSTDKLFYRIEFTDDPNHPTLLADFDGDHLRNIDELDDSSLFDLFEPEIFVDLNGNGFADYWETYWQTRLGLSELISWDDADGDGFTVAMEYELSLGLDRDDSIDSESPSKDDAQAGEVVLMIPGVGAKRVSEQPDSSNLL